MDNGVIIFSIYDERRHLSGSNSRPASAHTHADRGTVKLLKQALGVFGLDKYEMVSFVSYCSSLNAQSLGVFIELATSRSEKPISLVEDPCMSVDGSLISWIHDREPLETSPLH